MANQDPFAPAQTAVDQTEGERELEQNVIRFKKRMLEWDNPVEYVNNMYGSHPDDDGNHYFTVVFSRG